MVVLGISLLAEPRGDGGEGEKKRSLCGEGEEEVISWKDGE